MCGKFQSDNKNYCSKTKLYQNYIVRLVSQRSLEQPDAFKEGELKIYKENKVMMSASKTPSIIQRKKLV